MYVGLAVSKPPEPHESVWGSPGWCIQRRMCGVFAIASVCVCVILKKNNNLATPFPHIPISNERAVSLSRSLWSSQMDALPCRHHVRWLVYRLGKRGRLLVAWLSIPLSIYLSFSSFSSCFFLSFAPSPCSQMCLFMCRARWSDREKHLQRETCWKLLRKSQIWMKYVQHYRKWGSNMKTEGFTNWSAIVSGTFWLTALRK